MTKENKGVETNEEETNIDEGKDSTDASQNTEKKEQVDKQIPYERFKQKVNEANALKEKLAEIERTQEEAKRKELEEQNEYKTLYEQALQDAESAKQEALNTKKQSLLTQEGYGAEQITMLTKLIEGENEEDLAESIKTIKLTFPPQDNYGDPSPMNGERSKPKKTDAGDLGVEAFERIKNKIFK